MNDRSRVLKWLVFALFVALAWRLGVWLAPAPAPASGAAGGAAIGPGAAQAPAAPLPAPREAAPVAPVAPASVAADRPAAPAKVDAAALAVAASAAYARGDPDGEYRDLLRQANGAGAGAAAARAALAAFDRTALADPATGATELAAAAADAGSPLAEAVARWLELDGSPAAAASFYQRQGTVGRWRLAGPFGRFERASFFEKFPPEAADDNASAAPGAGDAAPGVPQAAAPEDDAPTDPAAWRDLPDGSFVVRPWHWAERTQGVMYLAARVRVPAAGELRMVVRGNCLWRAWLGAEMVSPGAPFAVADGHGRAWEARFRAAPGVYPLLVKVYPYPAAPDHCLSVSFPGGAEAIEPTAAPTPAAAGAALARLDPGDARALFPGGPAPADAGDAVVAAFAAAFHAQDEAAVAAWEAVTAAHPDCAAAWARRAAAEAGAGHLPPARRESLACAANATALRLDPDCVPALVALAIHECSRKRYPEARAYLDRALKVNPGAPTALAAAARLPLLAGWPEAAAAALARLERACPRGFVTAAARLELAEGRSDYAAAAAAAAALTRLAPAVTKPYFTVATAGLLSGRAEAALARLDAAPAALAAAPLFRSLRGQLLSAVGQGEEAEREFLLAAARGGGAKAWEGAGRERLRRGEPESAAAAFRAALRLEPDRHALRRLCRELEGGGPEFWEGAALDPVKAIKDFEKRTPPSGKTVRLIDQTVLDVYPDGSFANYTHGLQGVLTEGGVREAAQVERYGEVLEARTILPERELSLEPILLDGADHLLMPAVAPGAYIENKYLQTSAARPSRALRFPAWYFRSPNSEEAFVLSQLVVRVPSGFDLVCAARNLGPNVQFRESPAPGGGRVLTWTARNMNRALHEEGAPDIEETLPYVQLGSRATWDEVNRVIANYYLGRAAPTAAMRALVADLLRGLPPDAPAERRVGRILDYVCDNVEHTGWRAPASHILAQRSGDRVLVLLALLRAAGLDARLAAARPATAFMHAPIWEIPDAGTFTELLVTVPGGRRGRMWLYPALRAAHPEEIPENLAGAAALIVDPERGCEFATLPAASLERGAPGVCFATETKRVLSVAGAGADLRLEGRTVWHGAAAGELLEALADLPGSRQWRLVEERLGAGMPELALEDYSPSSLRPHQLYFAVDYRASLADTVRERVGGLRGVGLGFAPLALLPSEDFSNRRTPFHLRAAVAVDDVLELALPSGATAAGLPPDVAIRNEFGSYRLTFRAEGGRVRARRVAEFPPQRVSLRQWPSYRQMADAIAEHEKAVLWWQEAGAPATAAAAAPTAPQPAP